MEFAVEVIHKTYLHSLGRNWNNFTRLTTIQAMQSNIHSNKFQLYFEILLICTKHVNTLLQILHLWELQFDRTFEFYWWTCDATIRSDRAYSRSSSGTTLGCNGKLDIEYYSGKYNITCCFGIKAYPEDQLSTGWDGS